MNAPILLLTAAEAAERRRSAPPPSPQRLLLATADEARARQLVTATTRVFRTTPYIAPHRAAYEMA